MDDNVEGQQSSSEISKQLGVKPPEKTPVPPENPQAAQQIEQTAEAQGADAGLQVAASLGETESSQPLAQIELKRVAVPTEVAVQGEEAVRQWLEAHPEPAIGGNEPLTGGETAINSQVVEEASQIKDRADEILGDKLSQDATKGMQAAQDKLRAEGLGGTEEPIAGTVSAEPAANERPDWVPEGGWQALDGSWYDKEGKKIEESKKEESAAGGAGEKPSETPLTTGGEETESAEEKNKRLAESYFSKINKQIELIQQGKADEITEEYIPTEEELKAAGLENLTIGSEEGEEETEGEEEKEETKDETIARLQKEIGDLKSDKRPEWVPDGAWKGQDGNWYKDGKQCREKEFRGAEIEGLTFPSPEEWINMTEAQQIEFLKKSLRTEAANITDQEAKDILRNLDEDRINDPEYSAQVAAAAMRKFSHGGLTKDEMDRLAMTNPEVVTLVSQRLESLDKFRKTAEKLGLKAFSFSEWFSDTLKKHGPKAATAILMLMALLATGAMGPTLLKGVGAMASRY